MPKKLLFWIDDGLIQFGAANFLQDKIDYDFYAIYDTNHITKTFFKNQNFIKFKKVWFFREHLTNKTNKPDLTYLKSIEKKYGLNLWQIAYSDRRLFRFNEYHKFSYDEILSITEDECRIFEKIINEIRPDFLLIGVTDLHRNYLFTEMCRNAGITILMVWPLRDGQRATISSDYDTIDNANKKIESTFNQKNTEIKSEDYLQKNSAYKIITEALNKKFANESFKLSKFDIMMRHMKFLFFICNDEYRKFYENWGHTRLRFLTRKDFAIPFALKRWRRKSFLDKHANHNVDTKKQYIYFPLHHEPERTILIDAPFFTNQIEVISYLAKALPIDHKLYVKEHFSMKIEAWRDIAFYKQILDLPNVELIHPEVNPDLLLKNCSLVATITGTSALEAGFYHKPSIMFSDSSFSYLPFVQRVKNIVELPNIIEKCLKNDFDYSSMKHYLKLIDENSFKINWINLTRIIASKMHDYNGMTKEVLIKNSQMELLFDECKNEFDKLAAQYIKKIKEHEHLIKETG